MFLTKLYQQGKEITNTKILLLAFVCATAEQRTRHNLVTIVGFEIYVIFEKSFLIHTGLSLEPPWSLPWNIAWDFGLSSYCV